MWLVAIEEEIFFNLRDVFILVVRISDESRQRGEGDNNIWIELGRVEMGKEVLDTTGLVLQQHHRQTLRTIQTLALHLKTWN